jgi:hypothetical protein
MNAMMRLVFSVSDVVSSLDVTGKERARNLFVASTMPGARRL